MSKLKSGGAEYIVIGSGSAGAVLASRLSENQDCDVILLEAGGWANSLLIQIPAAVGMLLDSGRFNWNYRTTSQKNLGSREIPMPRGKVLGGSSSINGMIFVRGHPKDYDRWQDEGAEGWSYADVLPYFRRLEDHEDRSDAYHGQGGPVRVTSARATSALEQAFLKAGLQAGYLAAEDFNGYRQEGFGRYDMNVHNGRRANTAHAYLTAASKRKNLTIVRHAQARRVLVRNGRATGVEALVEGKLKVFHARGEVMICAGAINSPEILMRSGIGPGDHLRSAGIEVVADIAEIGENLQDHLEVHVQYRSPDAVSLYRHSRPLPMLAAGAQWLMFRSGPAASNHFEVGAFLKTRAEVPHPDVQIHFLPVCVDASRGKRSLMEGFRMHVGSMRSQSRGTVRLVKENPDAPPRIDPRYMSLEADWREMRMAVKIARDVAAQRAFDGLRLEELTPSSSCRTTEEIDRFIRETAMTAYHPSGTCRMGKDVGAVVDTLCRVQGVDALRVVDASVMPSIVSGNLNAPTMMIAEKIAAEITGKRLAPDHVTSFHRD